MVPHLTASTGAGDDVIYAENTGAKTDAGIAAGVLTTTLGDANGNVDINGNDGRLLLGDELPGSPWPYPG
ncbi:hypothetical protein DSL92_06115 [Billgrantia gudaonensis]|uniref:Uncharacterized protein n=1 Tax=Billgrantia gudaonensis TaxID=376427 RepID=A0A3S0VSP1_9GAMM|nr:hypothetical protein DSL92_06115 [Halomonas gudaonensis]